MLESETRACRIIEVPETVRERVEAALSTYIENYIDYGEAIQKSMGDTEYNPAKHLPFVLDETLKMPIFAATKLGQKWHTDLVKAVTAALYPSDEVQEYAKWNLESLDRSNPNDKTVLDACNTVTGALMDMMNGNGKPSVLLKGVVSQQSINFEYMAELLMLGIAALNDTKPPKPYTDAEDTFTPLTEDYYTSLPMHPNELGEKDAHEMHVDDEMEVQGEYYSRNMRFSHMMQKGARPLPTQPVLIEDVIEEVGRRLKADEECPIDFGNHNPEELIASLMMKGDLWVIPTGLYINPLHASNDGAPKYGIKTQRIFPAGVNASNVTKERQKAVDHVNAFTKKEPSADRFETYNAFVEKLVKHWQDALMDFKSPDAHLLEIDELFFFNNHMCFHAPGRFIGEAKEGDDTLRLLHNTSAHQTPTKNLEAQVTLPPEKLIREGFFPDVTPGNVFPHMPIDDNGWKERYEAEKAEASKEKAVSS